MRRIGNALLPLIGMVAGGCATAPPDELVREAAALLTSSCLNRLLSAHYQRSAQLGRVIFALSDDGRGNQACAYQIFDPNVVRGEGLLKIASYEQLELLALSKCEQIKPIGAPACRIFARDNEIIWNRSAKSTLD